MNKRYIYFSVAGGVIALLVIATFLLRDKENIAEYTNLINIKSEEQHIALMFVGDIMLDRGIRHYAVTNGGNDYILREVKKNLESSDLVVANLEGPITDNESVSAGTIPGSRDNYFFTFDPSWAKTLYQHNIRVVDLGNNHIENFGKDGIKQTEKNLEEAGVGYFGNPYGARSTIKQIKGIKIAFVSYNQFVSDLTSEWKAVLKEIQEVRQEADIVVVFCHWGDEYKLHPSEEQINLAHQFIDEGADLVVGAHPHVIQPMGEYKGKRIYYSLGNFVFDQYFSDYVREGLLLTVKINKATKNLEFSEQKTYLETGGQTILKSN